MSRGYRHSSIENSIDEPTLKKIFYDGLIDGINFSYTGSGSHSINTTINISTSSSDYYVAGQYSTPQIDLTNYSKLCFTTTASSGGGDKQVGIGMNNSAQTFTSFVRPGVGTYNIDISNLKGFYYINVYSNSGNRSGSNLKVSKIWLEK